MTSSGSNGKYCEISYHRTTPSQLFIVAMLVVTRDLRVFISANGDGLAAVSTAAMQCLQVNFGILLKEGHLGRTDRLLYLKTCLCVGYPL